MVEENRISKGLLFVSDTKLTCILTHQVRHLTGGSRVPYSELWSGKKCLIIILLKSFCMASTVVITARVLPH